VTIDYGLWNAIISTATLLVVAATAIVALHQIRVAETRADTTVSDSV
jgi:hypothetical protein